MKSKSKFTAALLCALAFAHYDVVRAQQSEYNVSTSGELMAAIQAANAWEGFILPPEDHVPFIINIVGENLTLAMPQMIIGLNFSNLGGLIINGSGATLDMGNSDRAFFIASGTVSINNLHIINGRAQGGAGSDGAGGGAGLGGGIFVANPTVVANGTSHPNLTLPTSVTLSNVSFVNNVAVGGAGAGFSVAGQGGGGGMGGNGGAGFFYDPGTFDPDQHGGGGGGGFGNAASGAIALAPGNYIGAQAGDFFSWFPTLVAPGGTGGNSGSAGGLAGGGGGASSPAAWPHYDPGAGGGIAGGNGSGDYPGNGGFGGGGGGGAIQTDVYGAQDDNPGPGGFGGGGGGGAYTSDGPLNAAPGGFGGGGGSTLLDVPNTGPGGFGAGSGVNNVGIGGGGAGLGGAVFVMSGASLTVHGGSFSGNSVAGGTTPVGGNAGSGYGADFFLGGDVTFNVAANHSVSLNNIGGAGNLSDPNVAANAADPNAQGGIIKTGAGSLTLTGTNYYTGNTTVNAGTLNLAAGAKEIGTQLVTVGQNNGDNATMVLGSSANLRLGGFNASTNGTDEPVMIAQSAGSTGTIVIGGGAGSSGADIGAQVFTGGGGGATVRFTQQYAVGSTSNTIYPFYTTLSGSLGLAQAGAGTTQLQPLYGTNTFTGAVVVETGTLSTAGAVAALAGTTGITINGGALTLGQADGVNDAASLTLNGGALQTGISLTETMGALTINGPSRIDFLGYSSALTFSELTIIDMLAIWNYSPDNTLSILTGTAIGDLDKIIFYSDSGTTEVGTAMFVGNDIMPVPEPSTYALLGVAAAGLAAHILRRRGRR